MYRRSTVQQSMVWIRTLIEQNPNKLKSRISNRDAERSFIICQRNIYPCVEHVDTNPSLLENEIYIYEKLSCGPGIPRIDRYGHECECRVMAFQLLGPNLEGLLNYCGRNFSLKAVLLPIGLAKAIEEPEERNYSQIGTTRYASINAYPGVVSTYDTESLGYVLIYFLKGSLSWQGLKADAQEHGAEHILNRKQSATDWGLYKDIPDEFKKYSEHVHYLRSDEKPSYRYLCRLFRSLFRHQSYEYDHVFD
ncbi:hypothetical protein K469DRAFT_739942 [Zopfia rhizophila CBS 207.26]|uniref:Non-specific serine/threonine protein kinase n=1 Tax=Zopfia rhizophila CBS 207.26 TaxID=1314779 RepID=A0A6A6DWD6_9PEZI|nr:hypothetical protein K469DRAFT_739942 [Zopfia rhizophila CBS 207.26]